MAFQTGSFSSEADLITTVKLFCTTNGWTVSGDVISKGTVFTALTIVDIGGFDYIKTQGGTGESGGSLTGASTGAAYLLGKTKNFTFSFPGTYYLFYSTVPDAIVCMCESNEGLFFNWVIFGTLKKYGSYTGGEYFGASYQYSASLPTLQPSIRLGSQGGRVGTTTLPMAPFWKLESNNYNPTNVFVRADIGIETGAWLGETDADNNAAHSNICAGSLIKYNPNTWNNQTGLTPFWVVTPRPSGFHSLLGLFHPARLCRVTNYEAGDVITLGSDKYMVFPFYGKRTDYPDGSTNTSGTFGWAISYDGP